MLEAERLSCINCDCLTDCFTCIVTLVGHCQGVVFVENNMADACTAELLEVEMRDTLYFQLRDEVTAVNQ